MQRLIEDSNHAEVLTATQRWRKGVRGGGDEWKLRNEGGAFKGDFLGHG